MSIDLTRTIKEAQQISCAAEERTRAEEREEARQETRLKRAIREYRYQANGWDVLLVDPDRAAVIVGRILTAADAEE